MEISAPYFRDNSHKKTEGCVAAASSSSCSHSNFSAFPCGKVKGPGFVVGRSGTVMLQTLKCNSSTQSKQNAGFMQFSFVPTAESAALLGHVVCTGTAQRTTLKLRKFSTKKINLFSIFLVKISNRIFYKGKSQKLFLRTVTSTGSQTKLQNNFSMKLWTSFTLGKITEIFLKRQAKLHTYD